MGATTNSRKKTAQYFARVRAERVRWRWAGRVSVAALAALLIGLLSCGAWFWHYTTTDEYKAVQLVKELRTALRSSDASEVDRIAGELIALGEVAVPPLIDAFAEGGVEHWPGPQEQNRVQALLRAIGAPALPHLIRGLNDPRGMVSTLCCEALSSMPLTLGQHASEVVPALRKTLNEGGWWGRMGAARVIRRLGPVAKDAVPDLRRALLHGHPGVRQKSVWALAAIGPAASEAIPDMVRYSLNDPDSWVRASACLAVGHFPEQADQFAPTLICRLTDGDEGVRIWAMAALKQLGPRAASALPAISDALDSPHEHMRAAAARALGELTPEIGPPAVPVLVKALKEKNRTVAVRLGDLGAHAEAALPALRKRCEGAGPGFAESLYYAIDRIEKALEKSKGGAR